MEVLGGGWVGGFGGGRLRYGDRAGGAVAAVGLGMRKGEEDGVEGGLQKDGVVFLQVSHSSREELLLFWSTHSILRFIKLDSATKHGVKKL